MRCTLETAKPIRGGLSECVVDVEASQMGERRLFMKRIATVMSILIAILLLSAMLEGSEQCMLSVDKTVGPGYSTVKFDGIAYRIFSPAQFYLVFTKVDSRYHRLKVIPINSGPMLFQVLSIQWGAFPSVPLGLDSADGNDFELDTETGYAEKVG